LTGPFGLTTGRRRDIFGVTGGVAEAVLRTAATSLKIDFLGYVDFKEVRGFQGLRDATVRSW